MKQIRIRIATDGRISAETLGMHGKECLKYVTILERLTDAVCEDSAFTAEYHAADVAVDDATEIKEEKA